MKRFSKMVSVMMAMPSACVISAMNCACRSVAKPGCSSVVMSTLCIFPLARMRRASGAGFGHLGAGLLQFGDERAQMLRLAAGEPSGRRG